MTSLGRDNVLKLRRTHKHLPPACRTRLKVDPMNKMTKLLISLVLLAVSPVVFACDYPAPPKNLPMGATASKDEMLAGVGRISEYQAKMTEYLNCIEAEEVVAMQALAEDDAEGKAQSKLMFDKKFNAAVDEQTRTVELFNAEIRAFKARSN